MGFTHEHRATTRTMREEHSHHCLGDIFRELRQGIRRDALHDSAAERVVAETVAHQAGVVANAPVNGTWDETGTWCEFWMIGLTGIGEGGLG